jgi:hypothetical protein
MSHDKIKAAARRRMAATGEPYAAARRLAITERGEAQGTSPVSAADIRAAAAAHRELGPEYSDAVVASFLADVDRAVAARVEARLADGAQSQPAKLARRGRRLVPRRVARDVLAGAAGALVAVGAVGLYAITSEHPQPASHVVYMKGRLPAAIHVFGPKLGGPPEVRRFTIVLPGPASKH